LFIVDHLKSLLIKARKSGLWSWQKDLQSKKEDKSINRESLGQLELPLSKSNNTSVPNGSTLREVILWFISTNSPPFFFREEEISATNFPLNKRMKEKRRIATSLQPDRENRDIGFPLPICLSLSSCLCDWILCWVGCALQPAKIDIEEIQFPPSNYYYWRFKIVEKGQFVECPVSSKVPQTPNDHH